MRVHFLWVRVLCHFFSSHLFGTFDDTSIEGRCITIRLLFYVCYLVGNHRSKIGLRAIIPGPNYQSIADGARKRMKWCSYLVFSLIRRRKTANISHYFVYFDLISRCALIHIQNIYSENLAENARPRKRSEVRRKIIWHRKWLYAQHSENIYIGVIPLDFIFDLAFTNRNPHAVILGHRRTNRFTTSVSIFTIFAVSRRENLCRFRFKEKKYIFIYVCRKLDIKSDTIVHVHTQEERQIFIPFGLLLPLHANAKVFSL